jgi:hypothetical protein
MAKAIAVRVAWNCHSPPFCPPPDHTARLNATPRPGFLVADGARRSVIVAGGHRQ